MTLKFIIALIKSKFIKIQKDSRANLSKKNIVYKIMYNVIVIYHMSDK